MMKNAILILITFALCVFGLTSKGAYQLHGTDKGPYQDTVATGEPPGASCDSSLSTPSMDSTKTWADAFAAKCSLVCGTGDITFQYTTTGSGSWTSGDAILNQTAPALVTDTTALLTPSTDYKYRFVFASDTGTFKDTTGMDTVTTKDSSDTSDYWLYGAPCTAPTISYSNNLVCTVGVAIVAQSATLGGGTTDSVKTVSTLPDGITVTKTGVNRGQVSGTPTVAAAKAGYRIRAYGCTTADAWDTITVVDTFCTTPPTISYGNAIVCTVGVAIANQDPDLTGAIDSIKYNSTFPAGLSITKTGANKGRVSGTPIARSSKKGYAITAYGCSNIVTYDSITVIDTTAITIKKNPKRNILNIGTLFNLSF